MSQAEVEQLDVETNQILESLRGEKSMARFEGSYKKLQRAWKTSCESEKRLFKRCNELNETIVNNTARVKAALRLTQEDSAAISLLKKEVDRAWKLVEIAKIKEDKYRKHIDMLKDQITSMNTTMHEGSGLPTSMDRLLKEMTAERDTCITKLLQMNQEHANSDGEKNEMNKKIISLDAQLFQKISENKTLQQEAESHKIKTNMLLRQIDDEKSRADSIKETDRANQTKITGLEKGLQAYQKDTDQLQSDLKDY